MWEVGIRSWKNAIVTCPKVLSQIYMERLTKTKRNMSRDSRWPGKNSPSRTQIESLVTFTYYGYELHLLLTNESFSNIVTDQSHGSTHPVHSTRIQDLPHKIRTRKRNTHSNINPVCDKRTHVTQENLVLLCSSRPRTMHLNTSTNKTQ
jgi:hypothetical protein